MMAQYPKMESNRQCPRKIMDPVLPIVFILGHSAFLLGTFGGPGTALSPPALPLHDRARGASKAPPGG